ncbi:MAG: ferritin family protein, partial [Planctomycetota bacterium]
ELEAFNIYEAQAEATDNALAKEVLIDISNEEREHAGEFMRLLELLAPDEPVYWGNGREEVSEMSEQTPPEQLDLTSLGGEHAEPGLPESESEDEGPSEAEGPETPSIGNLKD